MLTKSAFRGPLVGDLRRSFFDFSIFLVYKFNRSSTCSLGHKLRFKNKNDVLLKGKVPSHQEEPLAQTRLPIKQFNNDQCFLPSQSTMLPSSQACSFFALLYSFDLAGSDFRFAFPVSRWLRNCGNVGMRSGSHATRKVKQEWKVLTRKVKHEWKVLRE